MSSEKEAKQVKRGNTLLRSVFSSREVTIFFILLAMMAISAIVRLKKWGSPRTDATRPNATPVTICVVTTKNFLVLKMPMNGLHRNFSVHGSMISDVQNVVSLSSTPSPLNISTATIFNMTNGRPIAK